MSTLEDRVRAALREGPAEVSDGLADRVLAGVELRRRQRRVAAVIGAAVAFLLVTGGAGLWLSGGADTVGSVPAGEPTRRPGFRLPDPAASSVTTPSSVPAYLAALEAWIDCLREGGVRVTGPDEELFVFVDPDPALEAEREACVQLRPALSDQVERRLQGRVAQLPHLPAESGPRAPSDP
jgi:hypothetical protein